MPGFGCRCCAKDHFNSRELVNINYRETGKLSPQEMLKKFQGLQFSDNRFPQFICKNCLTQLKTAHSFYLQCQKSQQLFVAVVKNMNFTNKLPRILPKSGEGTNSDSLKSGKSVQNVKQETITKKTVYKCMECHDIFSTKRELLLHSKTHAHPNVCCYCYLFFSNKSDVEDHVITNHADFKFNCNQCEHPGFSRRRKLFMHLSSTHNLNSPIYKCNECKDIQLIGKESLLEHIETAHCTTNSITCSDQIKADLEYNDNEDIEMTEEFLDEIFLNQDDSSFEFTSNWDNCDFFDEIQMKNDLDSHDKQAVLLACTQCENKFTTYFELVNHLSETHNKDALICKECGQYFKRKIDIENHKLQHLKAKYDLNADTISKMNIIIANENRTVYECKLCKRIFKTSPNFAKHVCELSKCNSIKCTDCEENFESFTKMYLHRKATHNLPKIYSCSDCDKKFKFERGLRRHLITHENNLEKVFKCLYCTKQFSSYDSMLNHIQILHANIKRQICSLCDRTFGTLDHLKKHVMSFHQKERNHLCTECGKAFAQLCHLKQHQFIHRENKLKSVIVKKTV